MRIGHLIGPLTAAGISALSLGQSAYAELLIKVDKSAQHMTVTVDGKQLYDWPVSTGGGGYDTPSGSFKPFRMEIDHRSDQNGFYSRGRRLHRCLGYWCSATANSVRHQAQV